MERYPKIASLPFSKTINKAFIKELADKLISVLVLLYICYFGVF